MISQNCCRLISRRINQTNLISSKSNYCLVKASQSQSSQSTSYSFKKKNTDNTTTPSAYKYFSTSSTNNNNNNVNTTTTTKNNKVDHKDLDSHEESFVDHNQEIFKRDPKGFWIVVGLVTASVGIKLYYDIKGSLASGIREDINTINTSDDPQEKSEALSNIFSRISQCFNIETMYKEGVVDALVKSVNDSDPAVRSIAITVLTEFITKGYDVFGEEAVRKGIIPMISKNMISLNMNCDASIELWTLLLASNSNHDVLLNSHVFLENLGTLAHSNSMRLQEVVIETAQLLFANRDNYHLLPKLKSILHHLQKSKNPLTSNYAEQYIGVLDGRLVPPVGTTPSKMIENVNSDVFKVHAYYNLAVGGLLSFPYCAWRWNGLTNDMVYSKSRSFVGTLAIFGAGLLASFGLIPVYHSKSINSRIRDHYYTPSYKQQQQQKKKERGIFLSQNQNQNNQNNNNISTSDKNKNLQEEKDASITNLTESMFSVKGVKELFYTPASLFGASQVFPIFGIPLLLFGWRKSRYLFLPSLCIAIPYSLSVKVSGETNLQFNDMIFNDLCTGLI
ncbi:hypothetical protein DFA_09679 [Cavenderia fasciculata]|uniref:Armadillo repeat-containing domain-containing protein n=1 Tax=Cavenderia fasciculata TaxID=261658 RepID=F4Q8A7_CACFS|nr:uncharacterized protein DFA_09679 [Cavenderia fasciculata]EGG16007.1 hypothetical protein DFA_09679 [Cavenderia fasciculata]|eukprot:XP_004352332.1 hypothetical protein DFA_09679 [Cavenderia fasciculata]